jgi:rubrerythrin
MGKAIIYSDGALAAICSNLEKACDKQMKPVAASQFSQLSDYFNTMSPPVEADSFSELVGLIDSDISSGYAEVERIAKEEGDRGALRCMTWGKKVTSIHKSILGRYEKQGDALLEQNNLYVCEACGFIAIAKQVPALCPICKAPSSRFVQIS